MIINIFIESFCFKISWLDFMCKKVNIKCLDYCFYRINMEDMYVFF